MPRAIATVLIVLVMAGTAAAHKPSDAHLRLDAADARVTGRLDVAVRDLDAALAIDDGDGELTWGELAAAELRITEYVSERVSLEGCTTQFGAAALVDLSDGA